MPLRFGVIRQKVIVSASPAQVYDAFIDPRKHGEFTGSAATCTQKVGGRFTAWDGYISGKILELSKGRKMVQEWKTSEWPAGYPPSVLKLTFKAKGTRTELSMVHSKVPAEQVAMYTKGWVSSYWDPLREYFSQK
ncbi:MAG: SRPBCC domain-containing protein [Nitrososphaerales archaeon]|nr:SRPBCC domain-containing protein [Nitrososphaerales archaeon]